MSTERRPGMAIARRCASWACRSATCVRSAVDLGAKLDDALDARQVDPFVGELLDREQPVDVGLRVPPRVARRAARAHQALALVDAQRLRMHAGQLGRHADDEHRALIEVSLPVGHRLVLLRHDHDTPSDLRGESPCSSCSCRSRSFCDLESRAGTSTCVVTSRSPWPPLRLRSALALDAERLAVGGARGHLERHRPVERRHLHVRPERRLGEGDRQREREVVALAAEEVVTSHVDPHEQVARLAAGGPRLAPTGQLDAGAVLDPGGDLHLEGARATHRSAAVTGRARRLDDAPGRPTAPAWLRHREEPLVHRDLTTAAALGTGRRARTGGCARPVTRPDRRPGR